MRVLILGGYGTFGGRLATLLAGDTRLTLLIAGRSKASAERFCATLPPGAAREALAFERDRDPGPQIASVKPDLVVDATGPFQNYGTDPYRVVKACIENGCHYMDLADGAQFVSGVASFNQQALAADVSVLSGVSSFPVLTAAVVRRLARGFVVVDGITGGIAPSAYAGVGLNVIRAIADYSGKRLALTRKGRQAHSYALTETMRYTIAPPGHLPLRNLHFSLVDVPDLTVLPLLWPTLQDIWMGAGPVPEILHRALNALAWLVRLRLLPSLSPLAWLIYEVSNRVRWGEHRGGMFVAIVGESSGGARREVSWHLLAEGDDGPFIPSMACAALIQRRLEGGSIQNGARPATAELELSDYEALFRGRTIYTGVRETVDCVLPLYQRVLGEAWGVLPAPLRADA